MTTTAAAPRLTPEHRAFIDRDRRESKSFSPSSRKSASCAALGALKAGPPPG
ncbi:MAG TPA: hypothetical protein VFA32_12740 [Dehalococcoidia bacterium]|jgi:hypothetical protein|nr:hypothetical protein [Dehalococcoidia bacterium]